MYGDYRVALDRDVRIQHNRMKNTKVIATDRQWANDAGGSASVSAYTIGQVFDAVRDYYSSREWN